VVGTFGWLAPLGGWKEAVEKWLAPLGGWKEAVAFWSLFLTRLTNPTARLHVDRFGEYRVPGRSNLAALVTADRGDRS
jgi:hypothetical protein